VDLRAQSDRPKLVQKPAADAIVSRGVDGVRSLVSQDAPKSRPGAIGVEIPRADVRGWVGQGDQQTLRSKG
jgi:hypothetical protein